MMSKKLKPFHTEDGTLVTEEMLEELAEPWNRGEIPEGQWGAMRLGPGASDGLDRCEWKRVHGTPMGRPRLADEPTDVVSFKMPRSLVALIKQAAEACGQTKSKFIREAAIEKARKVLNQ